VSDVHKSYFPYTNECPQDGKPCSKEKCKLWLGEKECWYDHFGVMIEETFHTDRHDYIQFRDENNRHIEGIRHVHFDLSSREKTKFEEPPIVYATIGFNSYRLGEKVQEKFKLTDWELKSAAYEGGDDADLDKAIDGRPQKKEDVLDLLYFVRDLIPEIIQFEAEINTCATCRNKCEALTEYKGKAICGGCERKIILENIDRYVKK
jgi:hypothetical protein